MVLRFKWSYETDRRRRRNAPDNKYLFDNQQKIQLISFRKDLNKYVGFSALSDGSFRAHPAVKLLFFFFFLQRSSWKSVEDPGAPRTPLLESVFLTNHTPE